MIEFKNIVGESTLENGGYAGQLIALVMVHLNKAREEGQLTDGQVGEVTAATLNASIAQAIQFEMGLELAEENIKLVTAQIEQTRRKVL